MSVEVFLQGYSATGEDGLPVADVLETFGITVPPDKFGCFDVPYDKYCHLAITESGGRAVGITIFRPGDERIWQDIFSLLTKGPYLAFMGAPAVLVNAEVAQHAPDDMIESLGQPVLVSSIDDLRFQLIGR